MKDKLLIACCLLAVSAARSQPVTGNADTSYTINAEYRKHLKNYPFIKTVPELKAGILREKKNIVYCKVGERKLLLDIFSDKLKTKNPRAVIVMIHGGGWRSGHRSMHYPLVQRLAALGYICITPEYRLSAEALYPAAVHDLKAVIQWIRKNADDYNMDTSKIVLAGHSAGGELAAFLGATNGNRKFDCNNCHLNYSKEVQAVIDMDGTLAFIHPESGEGDDSKKISAATQWFGFSKTEKPALWKEAAPLTQVGAHMPPVLFINSSVARMHAGREDFIKILDQHKIYSEVRTFEASPHSFIFFNPWFDSTVIYIDRFIRKTFNGRSRLGATQITVAQDGSGHFATVQSAFDAVPQYNDHPLTIYVKKGVYREKLLLDSTKDFVTLAGEDKMNTILVYHDHTGKVSPRGDTINTRTSWSCKIRADNFTATNISFHNDAGYSAGQAVAIESNGDKAQFRNCRFVGNQDVLFTNSEKSRQYYKDCYIEGTTDFIFGSATVWFERCYIYSKKNSHITAASTPQEKEFGYIFNFCELYGDTSLHNVSLGRPWRPYAQVLYMHSYIGRHIKPEGWSNWNNTDNYLTARYAEYQNFGPGASPAARVPWAKQLSKEEAKKYTMTNVFKDWNPLK